MKWLNGYRMKLVLVGFVTAVVLSGDGSVKADFTFGEPVKFGSVNVWDSDDIVCFSSDGLEMYIDRWLSADNVDLYVLKRASVDDDWGPAVSLGPAVNSSQNDWIASISTDGLTLYFQSGRAGGYGASDIYMTTRVTRNDPWGPAVNMGPTINSSATDADVWISADGLELYFMSTRSGGYGGFDIWVTTRATENDPWGVPVNLGPVVNSSYNEGGAGLSPDGLLLLLQDNANPRTGGYGSSDFWMTRRASRSDPWQAPVNLGPRINGPGMEFLPRVSTDGHTLYFWGIRSGVGDVWQAPIVPIVDFNGDGIVDASDVCIMIDHWGENYWLCDIGPMPWGDGVVDVKDLVVLAEHLFEEPYDPFLIAHYKFDEAEGLIAADSAGDNDGMLSGEPVWQPGGGQVGGALQLNGVDDCVIAPFNFNPADGPSSVFSWVKDGIPGQVIVSKAGAANWLMADSADGALRTDLKEPATTGRDPKPPGPPLISSTVVTDGNWHRVGFVRDNINRILYVDDVEVARDTAVNLEAAGGGLYIGAGSGLESGTFWSGLIDDVRIYKRAVHP